MFDECIDFDGPISDGWNLVSSIENDITDAIPGLKIAQDALSTLFRKFHTGHASTLETRSIERCLFWALRRSDIKSVQLILDVDPEALSYLSRHQGIFSNTAACFIEGIFFNAVNILRLLLDKGIDFHTVFRSETATSISLWFSNTFFQWSQCLGYLYRDLGQFVERETSSGSVLAENKWHRDTLRDLLGLTPFTDSAIDDRDSLTYMNCESCLNCIQDYEDLIEPWWEELKHRVRNEQCICSLLGEAEDWTIDDECSLCRWCSQMSLGEPDKDSGYHTVELDSDDGIDSQDDRSGFDDFRCNRLARTFWPLKLFFHRQGGTWNGSYSPHEYYCFRCLAELEGWEAFSDTETSSQAESE